MGELPAYPRPEVLPLDADCRGRLEAARAWLLDHYADDAVSRWAPLENKLDLLATILEEGRVEADETWKLQAMGIGLGDALVQALGLEWATVEDAYGSDPALIRPGLSLVVHPPTMISKRIERGETVDVHVLFARVLDDLERVIADPRTA
ncbi:DUF3806 domain-containing protein [Albimonas sp. CAU 1670]|uniref:DUF3806 domain-containing protein n=1 Tax=Albimonas sp. CAU 1670 TaxID=3032599 RepID=UPI0023DC4F91|nr:DUF3806 domain-containing protein [Albimonas sp. CAU 1670]MDF2232602.1 DUF3806 domain-containing protein [Albimonas sp. CAU 1670]